MNAPRWEVADIIRKVGSLFLDSLTRAQRKVLRAIVRCRTAALGGHRDQCVHCGHQIISFFSCLMVSNPLWRGRDSREEVYLHFSVFCIIAALHNV